MWPLGENFYLYKKKKKKWGEIAHPPPTPHSQTSKVKYCCRNIDCTSLFVYRQQPWSFSKVLIYRCSLNASQEGYWLTLPGLLHFTASSPLPHLCNRKQVDKTEEEEDWNETYLTKNLEMWNWVKLPTLGVKTAIITRTELRWMCLLKFMEHTGEWAT